MTLEHWITEVGPSTVAKRLRIKQTTVCNWQKYRALPRAKMMVRIHKISFGAVTYKEMVEDFAKNNKQ